MTGNGTASFDIYTRDAGAVYSDIVEPILCLIVLFILVKIARSRNKDLKSAFFKFSSTTGLSAVLNILINTATRFVDARFETMQNRGLFLNILSCLSHTFALAMTLGKILAVATRFTSVFFPFEFKQIWSSHRVRVLIFLQFLIPYVLFAYMPFMPAAFAPTPDGNGYYMGTAALPFMIAKAFNVFGYLLFFITTIPMCIATVIKLVLDRKKIVKEIKDRQMITVMQMQHGGRSGASVIRTERLLAFCGVVLTVAHAIKAAQQTIWFVALIMEEPDLQATMISLYMVTNALTSFAEPFLLLITSKALRREVFGSFQRTCCKGNNTERAANTRSITF